MIIKSFELNKINLSTYKTILFYGKNEGLKNQSKNNLLKNKIITSTYEEKEIIENSNNIVENLNSKSLFENERIILIKRATDKIFKILLEIIDRKIDDLILIIDADNLEKKSKLRSFFEKDKNCICVPFYQDTDQTLSKLAFEFLKKKNISISNSNLNLILSKCNGDRKN